MSEEKKKKLTPKQKKFVKEYQKDLNATQAAKRAGYSEKTAQEIGSENLSKPIVAEAIKKDVDKTLEKLGIDAEYILGSIKETMERSKQATPVLDKKGFPILIENNKGDMVPAYTFEAHAVLKGAELLGKYKNLKIFSDKVEHSGEVEHTVKVSEIDLIERAKAFKKDAE